MRRSLVSTSWYSLVLAAAVLVGCLLPLPGGAQPFAGGGFNNPNIGATLPTTVWGRAWIMEPNDSTAMTNLGFPASPPLIWGTGTAYTVTDTESPIDFGTQDPNLTLPTAGTWLITYRVQYDWSAATTAATLDLTTAFVRRNNTPTTFHRHHHYTPVIGTATSATLGDFTVQVPYTTATAGDILGLDTGLSALPTAGSLKVTACNLTGMWAHP
jgi:hypothetical protein